MKKNIRILFLALLLTLTLAPMVALAEAVTTTSDTPYDWATLGTIGGATAATLLIVQYLKAPLDKVWKIPTRLLVYIIALLVLIGAQAFTSGLTLAAVPLIIVNAFVVALAAMGSYEATFARIE